MVKWSIVWEVVKQCQRWVSNQLMAQLGCMVTGAWFDNINIYLLYEHYQSGKSDCLAKASFKHPSFIPIRGYDHNGSSPWAQFWSADLKFAFVQKHIWLLGKGLFVCIFVTFWNSCFCVRWSQLRANESILIEINFIKLCSFGKQFTLRQHWSRCWLGIKQITSHYLKSCWQNVLSSHGITRSELFQGKCKRFY